MRISALFGFLEALRFSVFEREGLVQGRNYRNQNLLVGCFPFTP